VNLSKNGEARLTDIWHILTGIGRRITPTWNPAGEFSVQND
jgi:hypothetical protein